MEPNPLFYTPLAEWSKFVFFVILLSMIGYGVWRRRQGADGWANWIHAAIMLNFIVGVGYSGVRMLTTDEINDMLIRRIFAWEAWFNLACGSFYFLIWWLWQEWKTLKSQG